MIRTSINFTPQPSIMTLFRKFFRVYCRTLGIVLAINLVSNYNDFQNGKMDWQLSLTYSAIAVTAGFLIFIPMNRYYINRLLDWKLRPEQSFLVFILFAACTGGIMEFILQQIKVSVSHYPAAARKDNINDILFTAILFIVVALITTFSDFLGRWRAGIEEQARTEQLLLKSQFESLKNQVNPHFLFNALNTLTYLIREDEDNAVDFVQQLSRILRYSLEQQENITDTIQNELKIARAYLYLFKQRFRHKMDFTISIPETTLQKQIVCHSLTMLLENAIKHNEISAEKPLLINIYQAGDYLAIENILQPKQTPEPSTSIGLANIRDRYKMVTEMPVETTVTDEKWLVKIPMI